MCVLLQLLLLLIILKFYLQSYDFFYISSPILGGYQQYRSPQMLSKSSNNAL